MIMWSLSSHRISWEHNPSILRVKIYLTIFSYPLFSLSTYPLPLGTHEPLYTYLVFMVVTVWAFRFTSLIGVKGRLLKTWQKLTKVNAEEVLSLNISTKCDNLNNFFATTDPPPPHPILPFSSSQLGRPTTPTTEPDNVHAKTTISCNVQTKTTDPDNRLSQSLTPDLGPLLLPCK